ncbi:MAG TPA: hypothetical protein PK339_12770 [Flavitalea sp.]|nr:hypothetical protein [Flavitalea sp.]
MKAWKILFIILGVIFLLLGFIGVSQLRLSKGNDIAYQIGYILGALIIFLPSLLFFYLAYRQHRKLKKKKLNYAVDSFLSSEK